LSRRAHRILLVLAGLAVLVLIIRAVGTASVLARLRDVGWQFGLVAVIYLMNNVVRASALVDWRTRICIPSCRGVET
jgi:hypothetical protein